MIPLAQIKLILIAVMFAALGFFVVDYINAKNKIGKLNAALNVANITISKHKDNNLETERRSRELQSSIDNLNIERDRLLKRPSRCVCPPRPPCVHNGSKPRREHASEDGVRSEWLYRYATQAERLRIERNDCKAFVNEVWEKNR